MRFGKDSVSGQAAIEFILLVIVLGAAIVCLTMAALGSDARGPENEKGSTEFEQTQTGTIEGKYIDSADYGKHYYVTVRNNGYEADHEVSLAEYNAAQVGADFPIVLTDSDSVKADETQEQVDDAQAAAAKSQADESDWDLWWLMNNQMLTNMGNLSD